MRESRSTETEIVFAAKQVRIGVLVRETPLACDMSCNTVHPARPVWSSGNGPSQGLLCTPERI